MEQRTFMRVQKNNRNRKYEIPVEFIEKINQFAQNDEERFLMLIDLAPLSNSKRKKWLDEYEEFLKQLDDSD